MLYFSSEIEREIRLELNLQEGERLTEENLSSVEAMQIFANDLTGLQNLKKLRHLSISCDEIPLQTLKKMRWLKSLAITDSGIVNSDLHKIASLKELVSIDISSNENLTTLNPLAGMRGLKALDLSDNWRFSMNKEGIIDGLSKFILLEELCIDNIPLNSLGFLNPLVNLRVLEIADEGSNSSLKDILPLLGMKNLQHLNIWHHNQIEDYSVLKKLDALKSVYLNRDNLNRNNQMQIIDHLKGKGCTVELLT